MERQNPYPTPKPFTSPKPMANSGLPKKSEPSQKPKDTSLFGGKPFIHRTPTDRAIRRNPQVRKELRYDPDLRLKDQRDVDQEITKLEDRLFEKKYEKYGYTPDELKRTVIGTPKENKLYWEKKHDVAEKSKGGFDINEIRDLKKKEKELKILKKWAGLDKK